MNPSTRNITRVFRLATKEERADGIGWYARARATATALDPTSPVRGAAILAVLSPQVSWSRNVQLATLAYEQHHSGQPVSLPCLGVNSRKAAAILAGTDPREVVKGAKVRAFWLAIVDPNSADAIVVDRHALDVAVGRVTSDEFRSAYLSRVGNYAAVAALYRQAATILSREYGPVSPVAVQAVTWVAWRRTRAAHSAAARAGKLG